MPGWLSLRNTLCIHVNFLALMNAPLVLYCVSSLKYLYIAALRSLKSSKGMSRSQLKFAARSPLVVVERQRLWDQIGDLSNGGFLAHRNP
ncbi:MAG: hypothetical protein RL312_1848 [Pseudomonadota bacterium]